MSQVPPDVTIRPLVPADGPQADLVMRDAFEALTPVLLRTAPADEERRASRGRGRILHLQETDPEGCWVADRDGEVIAVAIALVREDVWGLSLFAVRPGLQGQGIGRRTLAGALRYGEGRRGRIILSSSDPRAMRSYHRAGLRIRPCVAAAGSANRSRVPAGLRARPGDPRADRELLDTVSREVRGAAHGPDLEILAQTGGELLVLDDRGFAVHREGSPALLAARDDEAAADLLWSCLAAAEPGRPVHIDFITEHNDWAVGVALDAGLELSPDGPVFVDGDTGTFRPYLPSGAYL